MTAHPNQRSRESLPVELRRTLVPHAVRAWAERSAGGRAIVRVSRLPGASSTAVHRLRFDGGPTLVLRRYVWSGYREAEPDAPFRELDALRFVAGAGAGTGLGRLVPEVIAADPTGADVGDGIPVLLMAFLPGRAVGEPDLWRLAELAAAVHAIDPAEFPHAYFPWYADITVAPPPGALRPELWDAAIELWHNDMPTYRPAFIHRDFHPGNVLWSRGRVTGIVDWANACRGPRGCDIAHCRANLIGWASEAAADRFLAAYEEITGETFDPFWTMASILEHGPSFQSPEWAAEQEPYLARAVAAVRGG